LIAKAIEAERVPCGLVNAATAAVDGPHPPRLVGPIRAQRITLSASLRGQLARTRDRSY
jgi:hypothetical protein